MPIDRIRWTQTILEKVTDEIDEMEERLYHLKNELGVAVRTLRGISRRTLDDF